MIPFLQRQEYVMMKQPSRKTKILFLTFGIFGLAMAIAVNM